MVSLADLPRFEELFDRSLAVPSVVARAQVDRIRSRYPNAAPHQVVRVLERRYLLAVTGTGGAVGAVAAVPAVGTGTALALTGGQVGTFLGASTTLALAVADVHGVELHELQRRRTLVLASLLGDHGSVVVEQELGIGTIFWARTLLTRLPLTTVKSVNKALAKRAATYGAAGGTAVAAGRLAPFGIGAVIGATGARAMGKRMVKGVHRAFGPPPLAFTRPLELAVDARAAEHAPVPAVALSLPPTPGVPVDPPERRP